MNAARHKTRAVFLDRDGTLIEDIGYLHQPEEVAWKEGAIEALRRLQSAGYTLVIITNQSGIGRGLYGEDDMHGVHAHMKRMLAQEGVAVSGIYHCPHHPDDTCECRKPEPGMLLQAARDLKLDLAESWLIGNACSDIAAGQGAGVRTILVYGTEECAPAPTYSEQSIAEAADRILALP